MKKLIVSFFIAVYSLLVTPIYAQIAQTNHSQSNPALSGAVYKVTPQRLEKYRTNALTMVQNFYATLPECTDMDVKENFIDNVMEPQTMLKVDFYAKANNKKEFLSPERYIMEFIKEYRQYIETDSGLELELSNIKYSDNLVHPEGDEHAVLLQLSYELTIRHNGKILKRGNSSAICYFPSRTDYRTCKVRQIMPVNHSSESTTISIRRKSEVSTKPTTTGKETAKLESTQRVVLHGQDYDTYKIVKTTPAAPSYPLRNLNIIHSPHPHLSIRLKNPYTTYIQGKKTMTLELLLENTGEKNIQIRPYANIYSPRFKCQATDNEGNLYENIQVKVGNENNLEIIHLRPHAPIKVMIYINNLSEPHFIRQFEWKIYSDELGVYLDNPIRIENIPAVYYGTVRD